MIERSMRKKCKLSITLTMENNPSFVVKRNKKRIRIDKRLWSYIKIIITQYKISQLRKEASADSQLSFLRKNIN
jgi:hypothetical protein